jgi:hypothetical protein
MGAGPIVAGLGLLLLVRTGPNPDYVSTILPGVVVFGLGLAATVAPLTATVLGSVESGHSGLASGVNNAVARVAGLLAIAVLGAIVSASFASSLDRDLAHRSLTPQTRAAVAADRSRPLVTDPGSVSGSDQVVVHEALVNSSVHAFRVAMGIGAGLAILGGVVALIGIANPRREVPCADCPGGAIAGASRSLKPRERAGVTASEPAA